jgi:CheY-like chemotaxis protein
MQERQEHCDIACFFSATALLQTSCAYDMFILDIQIPEQDGLTLAKKQPPYDFLVSYSGCFIGY